MSENFLKTIAVQEDEGLQDTRASLQASSRHQRPLFFIAGFVLCAALVFVAQDRIPFLGAQISSVVPSADAYQAVFLSTGQVYFGKLEINKDWSTLKNVYYLKINQEEGGQVDPEGGFELAKLGSEVHGPEDAMYIDSRNILFWENLRSDSQVVQTIQRIEK